MESKTFRTIIGVSIVAVPIVATGIISYYAGKAGGRVEAMKDALAIVRKIAESKKSEE